MDILQYWSLIEVEFHPAFGVDLGEPGILHRRSWRWLRLRLVSLAFDRNHRLYWLLNPPAEGSQHESQYR
jgi:hypothetical protein